MILATGFDSVNPQLMRDLFVIAAAFVGLAIGVLAIMDRLRGNTARVVSSESRLRKMDSDNQISLVVKEQADVKRRVELLESAIALCATEENVAGVRREVHELRSSGERDRSGIHSRLNALVEVAYEMRGTLNTIREHQYGKART